MTGDDRHLRSAATLALQLAGDSEGAEQLLTDAAATEDLRQVTSALLALAGVLLDTYLPTEDVQALLRRYVAQLAQP